MRRSVGDRPSHPISLHSGRHSEWRPEEFSIPALLIPRVSGWLGCHSHSLLVDAPTRCSIPTALTMPSVHAGFRALDISPYNKSRNNPHSGCSSIRHANNNVHSPNSNNQLKVHLHRTPGAAPDSQNCDVNSWESSRVSESPMVYLAIEQFATLSPPEPTTTVTAGLA